MDQNNLQEALRKGPPKLLGEKTTLTIKKGAELTSKGILKGIKEDQTLDLTKIPSADNVVSISVVEGAETGFVIDRKKETPDGKEDKKSTEIVGEKINLEPVMDKEGKELTGVKIGDETIDLKDIERIEKVIEKGADDKGLTYYDIKDTKLGDIKIYPQEKGLKIEATLDGKVVKGAHTQKGDVKGLKYSASVFDGGSLGIEIKGDEVTFSGKRAELDVNKDHYSGDFDAKYKKGEFNQVSLKKLDSYVQTDKYGYLKNTDGKPTVLSTNFQEADSLRSLSSQQKEWQTKMDLEKSHAKKEILAKKIKSYNVKIKDEFTRLKQKYGANVVFSDGGRDMTGVGKYEYKSTFGEKKNGFMKTVIAKHESTFVSSGILTSSNTGKKIDAFVIGSYEDNPGDIADVRAEWGLKMDKSQAEAYLKENKQAVTQKNIDEVMKKFNRKAEQVFSLEKTAGKTSAKISKNSMNEFSDLLMKDGKLIPGVSKFLQPSNLMIAPISDTQKALRTLYMDSDATLVATDKKINVVLGSSDFASKVESYRSEKAKLIARKGTVSSLISGERAIRNKQSADLNKKFNANMQSKYGAEQYKELDSQFKARNALLTKIDKAKKNGVSTSALDAQLKETNKKIGTYAQANNIDLDTYQKDFGTYAQEYRDIWKNIDSAQNLEKIISSTPSDLLPSEITSLNDKIKSEVKNLEFIDKKDRALVDKFVAASTGTNLKDNLDKFNEILNTKGGIPSDVKRLANLGIAEIYSKEGKTQEAINIYDDYKGTESIVKQLKYSQTQNEVTKSFSAVQENKQMSIEEKQRAIEDLKQTQIQKLVSTGQTDKETAESLVNKIALETESTALKQAGKYKEALEIDKKLNDISRNSKSFGNVGNSLLSVANSQKGVERQETLKDSASAFNEAIFRKLVESDYSPPSDIYALNQKLGNIKNQLGNHESALEDFNRAQGYLKSDDKAYRDIELSKADTYSQLEKLPEAKKIYESIINKKSGASEEQRWNAKSGLANAQYKNKEYPAAEENFKEIIKSQQTTDNQKISAKLNLARIHDARGENDESYKYWKDLKESDVTKEIKDYATKRVDTIEKKIADKERIAETQKGLSNIKGFNDLKNAQDKVIDLEYQRKNAAKKDRAKIEKELDVARQSLSDINSKIGEAIPTGNKEIVEEYVKQTKKEYEDAKSNLNLAKEKLSDLSQVNRQTRYSYQGQYRSDVKKAELNLAKAKGKYEKAEGMNLLSDSNNINKLNSEIELLGQKQKNIEKQIANKKIEKDNHWITEWYDKGVIQGQIEQLEKEKKEIINKKSEKGAFAQNAANMASNNYQLGSIDDYTKVIDLAAEHHKAEALNADALGAEGQYEKNVQEDAARKLYRQAEKNIYEVKTKGLNDDQVRDYINSRKSEVNSVSFDPIEKAARKSVLSNKEYGLDLEKATVREASLKQQARQGALANTASGVTSDNWVTRELDERYKELFYQNRENEGIKDKSIIDGLWLKEQKGIYDEAITRTTNSDIYKKGSPGYFERLTPWTRSTGELIDDKFAINQRIKQNNIEWENKYTNYIVDNKDNKNALSLVLEAESQRLNLAADNAESLIKDFKESGQQGFVYAWDYLTGENAANADLVKAEAIETRNKADLIDTFLNADGNTLQEKYKNLDLKKQTALENFGITKNKVIAAPNFQIKEDEETGATIAYIPTSVTDTAKAATQTAFIDRILNTDLAVNVAKTAGKLAISSLSGVAAPLTLTALNKIEQIGGSSEYQQSIINSYYNKIQSGVTSDTNLNLAVGLEETAGFAKDAAMNAAMFTYFKGLNAASKYMRLSHKYGSNIFTKLGLETGAVFVESALLEPYNYLRITQLEGKEYDFAQSFGENLAFSTAMRAKSAVTHTLGVSDMWSTVQKSTARSFDVKDVVSSENKALDFNRKILGEVNLPKTNQEAIVRLSKALESNPRNAPELREAIKANHAVIDTRAYVANDNKMMDFVEKNLGKTARVDLEVGRKSSQDIYEALKVNDAANKIPSNLETIKNKNGETPKTAAEAYNVLRSDGIDLKNVAAESKFKSGEINNDAYSKIADADKRAEVFQERIDQIYKDNGDIRDINKLDSKLKSEVKSLENHIKDAKVEGSKFNNAVVKNHELNKLEDNLKSSEENYLKTLTELKESNINNEQKADILIQKEAYENSLKSSNEVRTNAETAAQKTQEVKAIAEYLKNTNQKINSEFTKAKSEATRSIQDLVTKSNARADNARTEMEATSQKIESVKGDLEPAQQKYGTESKQFTETETRLKALEQKLAIDKNLLSRELRQSQIAQEMKTNLDTEIKLAEAQVVNRNSPPAELKNAQLEIKQAEKIALEEIKDQVEKRQAEEIKIRQAALDSAKNDFLTKFSTDDRVAAEKIFAEHAKADLDYKLEQRKVDDAAQRLDDSGKNQEAETLRNNEDLAELKSNYELLQERASNLAGKDGLKNAETAYNKFEESLIELDLFRTQTNGEVKNSEIKILKNQVEILKLSQGSDTEIRDANNKVTRLEEEAISDFNAKSQELRILDSSSAARQRLISSLENNLADKVSNVNKVAQDVVSKMAESKNLLQDLDSKVDEALRNNGVKLTEIKEIRQELIRTLSQDSEVVNRQQRIGLEMKDSSDYIDANQDTLKDILRSNEILVDRDASGKIVIATGNAEMDIKLESHFNNIELLRPGVKFDVAKGQVGLGIKAKVQGGSFALEAIAGYGKGFALVPELVLSNQAANRKTALIYFEGQEVKGAEGVLKSVTGLESKVNIFELKDQNGNPIPRGAEGLEILSTKINEMKTADANLMTQQTVQELEMIVRDSPSGKMQKLALDAFKEIGKSVVIRDEYHRITSASDLQTAAANRQATSMETKTTTDVFNAVESVKNSLGVSNARDLFMTRQELISRYETTDPQAAEFLKDAGNEFIRNPELKDDSFTKVVSEINKIRQESNPGAIDIKVSDLKNPASIINAEFRTEVELYSKALNAKSIAANSRLSVDHSVLGGKVVPVSAGTADANRVFGDPMEQLARNAHEFGLEKLSKIEVSDKSTVVTNRDVDLAIRDGAKAAGVDYKEIRLSATMNSVKGINKGEGVNQLYTERNFAGLVSHDMFKTLDSSLDGPTRLRQEKAGLIMQNGNTHFKLSNRLALESLNFKDNLKSSGTDVVEKRTTVIIDNTGGYEGTIEGIPKLASDQKVQDLLIRKTDEQGGKYTPARIRDNGEIEFKIAGERDVYKTVQEISKTGGTQEALDLKDADLKNYITKWNGDSVNDGSKLLVVTNQIQALDLQSQNSKFVLLTDSLSSETSVGQGGFRGQRMDGSKDILEHIYIDAEGKYLDADGEFKSEWKNTDGTANKDSLIRDVVKQYITNEQFNAKDSTFKNDRAIVDQLVKDTYAEFRNKAIRNNDFETARILNEKINNLAAAQKQGLSSLETKYGDPLGQLRGSVESNLNLLRSDILASGKAIDVYKQGVDGKFGELKSDVDSYFAQDGQLKSPEYFSDFFKGLDSNQQKSLLEMSSVEVRDFSLKGGIEGLKTSDVKSYADYYKVIEGVRNEDSYNKFTLGGDEAKPVTVMQTPVEQRSFDFVKQAVESIPERQFAPEYARVYAPIEDRISEAIQEISISADVAVRGVPAIRDVLLTSVPELDYNQLNKVSLSLGADYLLLNGLTDATPLHDYIPLSIEDRNTMFNDLNNYLQDGELSPEQITAANTLVTNLRNTEIVTVPETTDNIVYVDFQGKRVQAAALERNGEVYGLHILDDNGQRTGTILVDTKKSYEAFESETSQFRNSLPSDLSEVDRQNKVNSLMREFTYNHELAHTITNDEEIANAIARSSLGIADEQDNENLKKWISEGRIEKNLVDAAKISSDDLYNYVYENSPEEVKKNLNFVPLVSISVREENSETNTKLSDAVKRSDSPMVAKFMTKLRAELEGKEVSQTEIRDSTSDPLEELLGVIEKSTQEQFYVNTQHLVRDGEITEEQMRRLIDSPTERAELLIEYGVELEDVALLIGGGLPITVDSKKDYTGFIKRTDTVSKNLEDIVEDEDLSITKEGEFTRKRVDVASIDPFSKVPRFSNVRENIVDIVKSSSEPIKETSVFFDLGNIEVLVKDEDGNEVLDENNNPKAEIIGMLKYTNEYLGGHEFGDAIKQAAIEEMDKIAKKFPGRIFVSTAGTKGLEAKILGDVNQENIEEIINKELKGISERIAARAEKILETPQNVAEGEFKGKYSRNFAINVGMSTQTLSKDQDVFSQLYSTRYKSSLAIKVSKATEKTKSHIAIYESSLDSLVKQAILEGRAGSDYDIYILEEDNPLTKLNKDFESLFDIYIRKQDGQDVTELEMDYFGKEVSPSETEANLKNVMSKIKRLSRLDPRTGLSIMSDVSEVYKKKLSVATRILIGKGGGEEFAIFQPGYSDYSIEIEYLEDKISQTLNTQVREGYERTLEALIEEQEIKRKEGIDENDGSIATFDADKFSNYNSFTMQVQMLNWRANNPDQDLGLLNLGEIADNLGIKAIADVFKRIVGQAEKEGKGLDIDLANKIRKGIEAMGIEYLNKEQIQKLMKETDIMSKIKGKTLQEINDIMLEEARANGIEPITLTGTLSIVNADKLKIERDKATQFGDDVVAGVGKELFGRNAAVEVLAVKDVESPGDELTVEVTRNVPYTKNGYDSNQEAINDGWTEKGDSWVKTATVKKGKDGKYSIVDKTSKAIANEKYKDYTEEERNAIKDVLDNTIEELEACA